MTDHAAADVQAAFCSVLVDEWARAGIADAVVAPGSRSTPIVIALDAEPRIRVHVVLDERSAGFLALGLALASGRPALVATTSGTAAVELHPAVVEAAHAGVPLIAVTADRPVELHEVGAPQTVEQTGLYAPALRWAVSPGVAEWAAAGTWRSLAARCVAESLSGPGGPGPVHCNLAFREPLLGDRDRVAVPPGRPDGAPWHARSVASPRGRPQAGDGISGRPRRRAGPDRRRRGALGGVPAAGRDGVWPAGTSAVSADPDALVNAASRLGWPVFADPRSGCRIPAGPVVAAADALLRVPEVAAWRPDVVLRLGAPWASKVLGQWLAALGPEVPQVLVDPWGRWADPDRLVGGGGSSRPGPGDPGPGDGGASGFVGMGPPVGRRGAHDPGDPR